MVADQTFPPLPQSVLFCCDHNAVRSPMAEGIMKKLYGTECYIQSVGVKNDLEIDGFAVTVCAEMDVELSRHRSRSFDEMEQWGDDLSSFDLVLALSPASQRRAPTPAMATGAGARWATLVQGDLFHPLALDCATPAPADRGPTAR